MTVVVDASVALLWLVDLPASSKAEPLLDSSQALIAPDLIVPEIANALWKYVVFGQPSSFDAEDAIESLNQFFSDIVPTYPFRRRAMSISVELKHPAYDCFYLALAEQLSVRLVTADQRLIKRCNGTRFETLLTKLT